MSYSTSHQRDDLRQPDVYCHVPEVKLQADSAGVYNLPSWHINNCKLLYAPGSTPLGEKPVLDLDLF